MSHPYLTISSYHCIFGIGYPNGEISVISKKNKWEALNPSVLPNWKENAGNVLIDKKIGGDMPRGTYQLHILQMPEGIDDPINNLGEGELNTSQFRIE